VNRPKIIDVNHTIVAREDLVRVTLQMPLEAFEEFSRTVDASGVPMAQRDQLAATIARRAAIAEAEREAHAAKARE
jgi:hypothetical protein